MMNGGDGGDDTRPLSARMSELALQLQLSGGMSLEAVQASLEGAQGIHHLPDDGSDHSVCRPTKVDRGQELAGHGQ